MEKFPLTSQPGLSPSDQLFIDAMNYDNMTRAVEDGHILEGDDAARAEELKEKHKHSKRLTAELRASEATKQKEFAFAK